MSSEKNKWIDVIAKMLKLTQAGKLVWKSEQPPATFRNRSDRRVEIVFTTKYKEKNLRLYELSYQSEDIDINPYDNQPTVTLTWYSKPVLEIVDKFGIALWTFPKVSALSDLLSSVQFQVAGVKDLLDDFLKED
jgi:hypothetical protein